MEKGITRIIALVCFLFLLSILDMEKARRMTGKRKNQPVSGESQSKGKKEDTVASKRPKRQITSKSVDQSSGLSWREETDLKKALYASLQESKRLSRSHESGPSTSPDTKQSHHHGRLTRGHTTAPSRVTSALGRYSGDDSSQDSLRSGTGSRSQDSKKTTVHAQRKFAQGQSQPTTPSTTPVKVQTTPVKLFSKRAKTEDFLTFLCLRGSSVLPPHLDFFGYSRADSQGGDSRPNTPAQGIRSDSGETRESTPDLSSSSDSDMRDELPELANLVMKNQQTPTRKAARASASTPETARGLASIRTSMAKKVGKVPAKALLKRSKTLLASPTKMSPREKRALLRRQRSPSKLVRFLPSYVHSSCSYSPNSHCPPTDPGGQNKAYVETCNTNINQTLAMKSKLVKCRPCYVDLCSCITGCPQNYAKAVPRISYSKKHIKQLTVNRREFYAKPPKTGENFVKNGSPLVCTPNQSQTGQKRPEYRDLSFAKALENVQCSEKSAVTICRTDALTNKHLESRLLEDYTGCTNSKCGILKSSSNKACASFTPLPAPPYCVIKALEEIADKRKLPIIDSAQQGCLPFTIGSETLALSQERFPLTQSFAFATSLAEADDSLYRTQDKTTVTVRPSFADVTDELQKSRNEHTESVQDVQESEYSDDLCVEFEPEGGDNTNFYATVTKKSEKVGEMVYMCPPNHGTTLYPLPPSLSSVLPIQLMWSDDDRVDRV